MAEKTKKPKTIKINERTKNVLVGIQQAISELQIKAQLIIQTYLDAKEKEGDYQLSKDMSMLIKKEGKT